MKQISVPGLLALMGSLSLVLAADSCSKATTTISGSNAASSLASACKTFTGDIVIATGASDSITLDGLEEIQGSFIALNNSFIPAMSSDSLSVISDNLTLDALQILSTFSFPSLTRVGSLTLNALAGEQVFDALENVESIDYISIQNTQIQNVTGFRIDTVDAIFIANNPYMMSLEMFVTNITTSITIEENGLTFDVNLPNLDYAGDITIRNASSVSLSSLTEVAGSLTLIRNTFTDWGKSGPLQTVGSDVVLESNTNLSSLSLPVLKSITGGLSINNNTELYKLDLFTLEDVNGAIDLEGNFTDVEFPALETVRSDFVLRSSGNASCDDLNDLWTNGVIKGKYTCDTTAKEASSNSSSASSSSTSSTIVGASSTSTSTPGLDASPTSSPSGLTTGAKAGIGVGVCAGVITAATAAAFALWRRRKSKKQKEAENQILASDDGNQDGFGKSELPGEAVVKEMPATQKVNELGNEAQRHELQGGIGASELHQDTIKAVPGMFEMDGDTGTQPQGRVNT